MLCRYVCRCGDSCICMGTMWRCDMFATCHVRSVLGPIVYLCRCEVSCLISVLCLHRATDEWDADVYMLQAVIHNVYDVSDGFFNHGCGKSGVAVSLQSGRPFRVSERWKQRGVGLAESTGWIYSLATVPSGTLDLSSRTSLQGISGQVLWVVRLPFILSSL